MSMQFYYNYWLVTLIGDPSLIKALVSFSSLLKLSSVDYCALLWDTSQQMTLNLLQSDLTFIQVDQLNSVVGQFASVFSQP